MRAYGFHKSSIRNAMLSWNRVIGRISAISDGLHILGESKNHHVLRFRLGLSVSQ